MMVEMSGSIERTFQWPPKLDNAAMHSALCNTSTAAPFHQGQGESVVREKPSTSSVTVLFRSRRPAHIPRCVGAIVVWKAIQAVLGRWSWPDVVEECSEAFLPLCTDPNPTSPILRKFFTTRCVASVLHVHPGPVFRHAADSLRLAAFAGLGEHRAFVTPTGRGVATLQILPHDHTLCPTVAATQRVASLASAWCWSNDHKLAEPFTRAKFQWLRHVDSLSRLVNAVKGSGT